MTDFIENTADQTADSTFTDEKIENETPDTVTFEDLGLDEYTLKAVEKKGFVTPSPIQVLAIPRLLTGDTNLIARARTGTGKTAAFGLPIIQNVRGKSDHVEALILEPTRELAMQTCTEMQSFSTSDYPRTTVLYGGASYAAQIKDLKRGCEVVVGTPGRIKDHIDRKTLDLSKIKYFILDEGDEMLDMGFIDDIEEIFRHANPDCRILLFSATMPAPILKIAGDFMGEYDIIEEENVIDEALLIDQKYWVVKESEKIEALVRLIDISPDFYGLVFTMTKSDADRVTRELDLRGYEAAALHGDIMQNQREKVLERFRMKKTRILVATDVAARGIDIKGVSHVVNYSLPFDTATYVHRIGRTGRAGTEGIAVTFVRPEERRKLGFLSKNIKKATKSEFIEGKIPSVNEVLNVKNERVIKELKEKVFNTIVESSQSECIETSEELNNDATSAVVSTSTTTVSTVKSELLTPLFTDLAAALCEGQDAQQVLAGVLSTVYGDQLSPKHYGKINTVSSAPRGDQKRIFISLGKKDGYRAKEIADYFSELLHIPGRLVDDIDVAQQFSLVSLPVASARKAIEMSKSNRKLPHMHFDEKDGGRGPRRPHNDKADFAPSRSERPSRGKRDSAKSDKAPRGRLNAKGNKPNVHAQTERSSSRKNGGAALYKKNGKKAERF
ncbi:ATP-dependent RNA helicase DeaD [Treponema bryantii]|uniref:ATP-dependent RNA helicase DeaD n=1 Tax=Treponema bryantii TaxID=163 RepID=A0A1H9FT49_9SPIR|nr:DEAD/DEAH box helicase [Treponema bryantii]SEQ41074.1 ATP-dependent RNA helicase DeaD [Treponema bryantii]